MTSPMEVFQLLPKTNCKLCGEQSCMAFAFKLISKEHKLEDCSPLYQEKKYASNREKLEAIFKKVEKAIETGLIIHSEKCFGCGNCVVACPVNVAEDPTGSALGLGPKNDKVILRVVKGVITANNVQKCRRFGPDKILCNGCIVTCPSGAIEFI